MRVTIRNETYPTARAAAKACGVTPGAIYHALENGNIDNVGLGHPKGRLQVTLLGKTYKSITHCAEALRLNRGNLSVTLSTLRALNVDIAAIQLKEE